MPLVVDNFTAWTPSSIEILHSIARSSTIWNGLSMGKAFHHLVERLSVQLYRHNSDDEDSSVKVDVSDGMQVLQDVCGDVAGIGATDSNYEDNVCAFYAPDNSTCFAVPISNWFSTLDVEEVPLDTQLPEPPDHIDLVPPPQLQHSNRRKSRG